MCHQRRAPPQRQVRSRGPSLQVSKLDARRIGCPLEAPETVALGAGVLTPPSEGGESLNFLKAEGDSLLLALLLLLLKKPIVAGRLLLLVLLLLLLPLLLP